MARSTYIYVVTDARKQILAAFTVKHELVSWLERQVSLTGHNVWRVADGGWARKPPADMTAEVVR